MFSSSVRKIVFLLVLSLVLAFCKTATSVSFRSVKQVAPAPSEVLQSKEGLSAQGNEHPCAGWTEETTDKITRCLCKAVNTLREQQDCNTFEAPPGSEGSYKCAWKDNSGCLPILMNQEERELVKESIELLRSLNQETAEHLVADLSEAWESFLPLIRVGASSEISQTPNPRMYPRNIPGKYSGSKGASEDEIPSVSRTPNPPMYSRKCENPTSEGTGGSTPSTDRPDCNGLIYSAWENVLAWAKDSQPRFVLQITGQLRYWNLQVFLDNLKAVVPQEEISWADQFASYPVVQALLAQTGPSMKEKITGLINFVQDTTKKYVEWFLPEDDSARPQEVPPETITILQRCQNGAEGCKNKFLEAFQFVLKWMTYIAGKGVTLGADKAVEMGNKYLPQHMQKWLSDFVKGLKERVGSVAPPPKLERTKKD